MTGHRTPAAAVPTYRHVVGPRTSRAPAEPPPAIGRARVDPTLTARRRALRRRAWAWRLLLTGWAGLTGLVAWYAYRWAGIAGLGCPALLLVPLLLLAWCAASDLRERERELRAGR